MRKHLYVLVITVVMAMVLVACSSTETTLPGVDGDVADGDSVDGDVSDVVEDVEDADTTDKTDDVDPVEDDATDDVDDVDQVTDGDDEPDAVDTEGFEDGDIELPPTPCGISGTLRVSDDFVDGDEVNVMLFDEYPFNFSDDFPNASIARAMYNEWNIGRSVPYSFENIAAGTYWVLVQAEKSPYLAVPAGGPWELTVDGGCNLENLDIYLGAANAQAGSISGNAVLADSWGDPEQYIIIVNALPTDQWPPNDTDSWPAAIEIIIPVDSSLQGRSFPYALGNLPEGNYMVFAWLNRLSDDTQMAMAQHPTPLVIDYDLSKDYENIDLLFRGQQTDGDVDDVDVDDEPEPLGSLGGDLHISQTIVDDSMRVAVLLFDQQPFGENSPGPIAATELTSFPGLKSAYTFNDLPAGSYWLVGAAAEAGAENFENPTVIALYPDNPVVFVPNDPGFDSLDIYLDAQSPQLGSISGRAWIPAEFNNEDYELYCLATNEEPDFETPPDVAAFTPVFPLIEEGIYAFGDFTLPNLAARDYWVVCALENSETGAMLSVDWDGPFTVAENGPGAHIDGGEYYLGVGDPSLGSISGVVETLYAPPQGFMVVVGLYDQEPAQGVDPVDYALTLADGQTTEFPYMLDNLQSDDYWVGAVLLAGQNRPAGMVQYAGNPITLDISDPDAKDWTDIDMTLYNGALEGTLDVLPPFQSPGSMAWLSMTPPDTERTLFVEVSLSASSSSLGHLEGPFVLGGFYPAEYTVAVFFDTNGNGALDQAEKTAPVFATPRNYTYPDASQASQDFSASFPQ